MQKVKLFDSIDAAAELIPEGQIKLVKIDSRKVCLAISKTELFAFENSCPHLGHPLHEGNINPFGEVVCPLHTYRFNLKTGGESSLRCKPLKTLKTAIIDGSVYLLD
ncbi:MAG: Rieske 2Fe-2S domain-containing protein [Cyclobacteriaceae bacterium]